ncbi:hypothetical protein FQZ97_1175640 [compost metagenome]
MTIIPMPELANSRSNKWISDFAPTSMPRVGSSIKITFGRTASCFAIATFCWLPPLNAETGISTSLILTLRCFEKSFANCFSLFASIKPNRVVKDARFKTEIFCAIERSRKMPEPFRSSDKYTIPAFTASAYWRISCS